MCTSTSTVTSTSISRSRSQCTRKITSTSTNPFSRMLVQTNVSKHEYEYVLTTTINITALLTNFDEMLIPRRVQWRFSKISRYFRAEELFSYFQFTVSWTRNIISFEWTVGGWRDCFTVAEKKKSRIKHTYDTQLEEGIERRKWIPLQARSKTVKTLTRRQ